MIFLCFKVLCFESFLEEIKKTILVIWIPKTLQVRRSRKFIVEKIIFQTYGDCFQQLPTGSIEDTLLAPWDVQNLKKWCSIYPLCIKQATNPKRKFLFFKLKRESSFVVLTARKCLQKCFASKTSQLTFKNLAFSASELCLVNFQRVVAFRSRICFSDPKTEK